MTGETPNPLDGLRELLRTEPMEPDADWNEACAEWLHEHGSQVADVVEAAQAVVRNGARMPASDPPIVPDEISDLRAALVPFGRTEGAPEPPPGLPARTPMTEREPVVFDMDSHKGWGNRISWTDWDKRRVNGHMTPKPRVGDELRCKLQSGGIGRFRVIEVEHAMGVPDMFFATVEDIGYADEDAPPVTRLSVFGGILRG